MKEYGYFDDNTNEYVITTPLTPRPWENRIWNHDLNIQQTNHGTGITYQRDHTGNFVLYNYSWDKGLYVYDKTTGKLFSPAWFPVNTELDNYEVRHGLNYTRIKGELDGIEVEWLVTVHPEHPTEIWRVEVRNKSTEKHELLVVPFYEINISFNDPYFGPCNLFKSKVSADTNALYIKNYSPKCNLDYYAVCFHSDLPITKYEMDRKTFLKQYSSMSNPYTVTNDKFDCSEPDMSSPVLAAGYDLSLKADQHQSLNVSIFSAATFEDACARSAEYGVRNLYEEAVAEHAKYYQEFVKENSINTGCKEFDRYVNVWIKQQLRYNGMWNRGWNMGFRDSMQDCDSYRRHDTLLVRNRIMQASRHIYKDGHTVRSFAGIDDKMYFDGGVWFVNTVVGYIEESGDEEILKEVTPYLDGEKGDILDHMKRAMNFLDQQRGATGICRMGFGDWNDALTGVDREGKGESVWTSMAFIWSLERLCELLEYLNDADLAKYQDIANGLKKRIKENCFEGDRYIRAINDAGEKIGSRDSEEGKVYLNTQSWALISGIADESEAAILLKTVADELETPFGPVLLNPPYTTYHAGIGRITSDEPGYVENGANYVHAAMFYAYGLVRGGKAEAAFDVIKRVLPANPDNPSSVSLMEPFNITNSLEGKLSKHPGRAKFAWRTGSAGWMLKVIWDGFVGINPGLRALSVKPCLPESWGDVVEVSRKIRGKNINFTFFRNSKVAGEFDLVVKSGDAIAYDKLENVATVAVEI